MQYEPAIEGTRPEGVSIIFGVHMNHNEKLARHYYVFFPMRDGYGYTAEHLYDVAGHDLGTYIGRGAFDNVSYENGGCRCA
jgi:hypothetical protein